MARMGEDRRRMVESVLLRAADNALERRSERIATVIVALVMFPLGVFVGLLL